MQQILFTWFEANVPGLELSDGTGKVCWQLPSFPLKTGYTQIRALEEMREEDGMKLFRFSFTNSPAMLVVQVISGARSAFLRLRYRLEGEDRFSGHDKERPILYGAVWNDQAAVRSGQPADDNGQTAVRSGQPTDDNGQAAVHNEQPEAPEQAAFFQTLTEIQLSQFDRVLHSFVPVRCTDTHDAWTGREVTGPIILMRSTWAQVLAAYEHGAQAPDHFLAWFPDTDRISLRSVKGNYYDGQPVEEYAAPWIELGLFAENIGTAGVGEVAIWKAYRRFLLEEMALFGDSRKPLVFYNTWHMQEGKKYFCGDSYLKYLKDDFILKDIDIAHRMGVEVYVIDTGWFSKTGDWEVNEAFFPNRLEAVRKKLDSYGMRLGLWFNPIAAARTSVVYRTHPDYVMSWQGEETFWGKIWETEESFGMCLASGYSDIFIETLVRLNRELGVSYFKWDAVGQYGCDCPHHLHGSSENAPSERADAYAYRMGLEMIRIASEVSRRCPGAIVDFDVTEGGRSMGLGFLSAGKYFLINNGPYFSSLDIPDSVKMEPDTINVFFYPGAARPQVCRQSARYDPYVPSVLFLTHFFPHGPGLSRKNSMAAFALGGNGVWGFLQEMDEDGILDWADFLERYKEVREDVTAAYPVVSGTQGGSPEIHEKLNTENGRGIVVFFTHGAGTFTHVTQPLKLVPAHITGAQSVKIQNNGRVRLTVELEEDEALVVFFH